MKISEVAALAGVHHQTVRKHIAEGKLNATFVKGRPPVWLIGEEEGHRYAAAAKSLLEKSGHKVSAELSASDYTSARRLQEMASISRPTLIKHLNGGLVRGEYRTFGGRKILVFAREEALRYATIARDLVEERTEANSTRGPRRAPQGFVRLDDLAREMHVSVFALYAAVKEGGLKAVKAGQVLLAARRDADEFTRLHGRREPVGGMISIPEAMDRFSVSHRAVDYAISRGYIAAIPDAKAVSHRSGRISRPKTLISENDAYKYFKANRSERRRDAELEHALALARKLETLVSDD